MRLDAYYYGFDPTGNELIDRILSAVACAGKAYHHTEDWHETVDVPYEDFLRGECPQDWIQNAANDAMRRCHNETRRNRSRKRPQQTARWTQFIPALPNRRIVKGIREG